MLSKMAARFGIAVLVSFAPVWVANAQIAQDRPATPQATPKDLGTKKDNAVPCSTFLTSCQNTLKTRNEQIQALEQETLRLSEQIVRLQQETQKQSNEIAKLRPQAALPICAGGAKSTGEAWLHPTIPTVMCGPYVCGATPFSCKRSCNSKLDCATGMVCTADGVCTMPPKQK